MSSPDKTKPESIPPSQGRANGVAWLVVIAAVWCWTWRHLEIEWRLNDQYNYGYFIPLVAAYLAWVRLESSGLHFQDGRSSAAPFVVAGISLGIFFIAELLRQQDPTWRLVSWMMNLSATALTLTYLWRLGGRPLVTALAIPIAFTWLALPWPSAIENRITLGLLRLVTAVTVDLCNWTGIAALQRGNAIELSSGMVGVDTACSGVQSMQASIVASLCLGELLRLSLGKRTGLFLGAILIATLGNLTRVFILTRATHSFGPAGLEAYHDVTGYTASAVTFIGILALGTLLSRKGASTQTPAPPKPLHWQVPVLNGFEALPILAVLVAMPFLTRAWWSAMSTESAQVQRSELWTLRSEGLPSGWQVEQEEINDRERAILRFTHGESISYRVPSGPPAHVYHMFWEPKVSVPSLAFSHSPDICMAQVGWQQIGNPEIVNLHVKDRIITCAIFRFRWEGLEQSVLHARWYGGEPELFSGVSDNAGSRQHRFGLLWSGGRRRGHEAITAFLPALPNRDAQAAAFQFLLETVLVAR